jgi:hypothetical protein
MFEVPLDLQLKHHSESKTLGSMLKEVSDVICHCCYQPCSRTEGYSQSGEGVGCQQA